MLCDQHNYPKWVTPRDATDLFRGRFIGPHVGQLLSGGRDDDGGYQGGGYEVEECGLGILHQEQCRERNNHPDAVG